MKRDPTLKIERKITESMKLLWKEGYIDDHLCDSLTPHTLNPRKCMDYQKVHKDRAPMRPIVPCIGSSTYRLAKDLAKFLTPYQDKSSTQ